MTEETVGSRLKKIRKHFKLSQLEFMEITGYASKQVLSNMEKGDRTISVEKAEKIQNELGINMNWLLLGKGAMEFDPDKVDEILKKRGILKESTPSVQSGESASDILARIEKDLALLKSKLK